MALQRRLWRAVFERASPAGEIGFEHVEAARALCQQTEGDGRKQLPGLDLMRSFGEIRVLRQADLPQGPRNFRLPLAPTGIVELPDGEGIVQTTVEEISQYNESGQFLDWGAVYSAIQNGKRLELRNWRPGEEFQRVGRDHPEKLKELFQKFRIPLWQRRGWPIVVIDDEPIWARQFGPAAGYAARAGSEYGLRVEWKAGAPVDPPTQA